MKNDDIREENITFKILQVMKTMGNFGDSIWCRRGIKKLVPAP